MEINEDEGFPGFDLHWNEAVVFSLEILHTVKFRHAFQGAVESVVPPVVRAVQDRRNPALFSDNLGGVMTADVVERAQRAVASADGYDRFASYRRGHELARLFHLIDASDDLPCFAEDREAFKFGN